MINFGTVPETPPGGALGALGRLAASLKFGSRGAGQRVMQQVRPWIEQLTLSGVVRWLPHLALGAPCHIQVRHLLSGRWTRCTNVGCGPCVFCQQTVCLDHSFVASSGDLLCFACVTKHQPEAPKGGPAPSDAPPGPEPRPSAAEEQAARAVLEVSPGASWLAVQASYRKLAFEAHPDRGGSVEQFKRIGHAYDVLKKVYGQS